MPICSIAVLLLFLIINMFLYKQVLLKEDNPIQLICSIYRLNFTSSDMIKVTEKPIAKYLIKDKGTVSPFIKKMSQIGWKYKENVGAGIVFEKNGELITISTKKITSRFTLIWYNESDIK